MACSAGIAFPAFSVYRTELFPTGRRGQAGGLIVAMALVGGSLGLLLAGFLIDRGWSYGSTMGLLALAQVVTAVVVFTTYPETAHRDARGDQPRGRVNQRPRRGSGRVSGRRARR